MQLMTAAGLSFLRKNIPNGVIKMELLIARLPGDAEAYGETFRHTAQDEVKYVMVELLGFLEDRIEELEVSSG